MRLFIPLIFGFLAMASGALAQELPWAEGQVKELCKQEWPEDFSMQAYCVRNNKAGHIAFIKLTKKNDPELFKNPFSNCVSEWGIQWDMVAYCAGQQVEGQRAIGNNVKGLPEGIAQRIVKRCKQEWRDDYSMIAYCSNQQASAWDELNK